LPHPPSQDHVELGRHKDALVAQLRGTLGALIADHDALLGYTADYDSLAAANMEAVSVGE
jgi:hypothetical protein